jgi:hypothetical protein
MYWLYGGALQFGSASVEQYDGAKLAVTHDVIVVSGNYRTNGMSPSENFMGSLILTSLAPSFRLLRLARTTYRRAKCWVPGPTPRSRLGTTEYSRVWR